MTLDAKETLGNLLKKGFKEATNKSNDHKWVEFWNNDKLTRIKTKISHGEKDLDDYLIGHMSRQTLMTKKDFTAFAKCELSELEYVAILNKNHPDILPKKMDAIESDNKKG